MNRAAGFPDPFPVIEAIYEAAVAPDRWVDALGLLNRHLGLISSFMVLADRRTGVDIALNCGLDPELLSVYTQHYWTIDPGLPVFAKSPPGTVVTTNSLMSNRDYAKTEFAELVTKYGLFYCGGALLARSQGRDGVIAIQRPRTAEAFEQADLTGLLRLAPHLGRAFQIARLLSTQTAERQTLSQVLNACCHGVVLLDGQGEIVFINAAAERLMRGSSGLSIEKRKLTARLPGQASLLDAAVWKALAATAGLSLSNGATLRIGSGRKGETQDVLCCPLPGNRLSGENQTHRAAAIVFIVDSYLDVKLSHDILRQLFGLTAAEAGVAEGIANGMTPDELADARGTDRHTVRGQVQAALQKTDTCRQAELAKVVLTSAASIHDLTKP